MAADEPEKPDRYYGHHHHHIRVMDVGGDVRVTVAPTDGGNPDIIYIPRSDLPDDYQPNDRDRDY